MKPIGIDKEGYGIIEVGEGSYKGYLAFTLDRSFNGFFGQNGGFDLDKAKILSDNDLWPLKEAEDIERPLGELWIRNVDGERLLYLHQSGTDSDEMAFLNTRGDFDYHDQTEVHKANKLKGIIKKVRERKARSD